MRCPRCGCENRTGAKFCNECAAPLPLHCDACGAENRPGANFCDACGTALATPPPASSRQRPDGVTLAAQALAPMAYTPAHLTEKIRHATAALAGERKQVTVLFADLKGSMALLADRDPEEARQLLDPVLERLMAAVHRYEGTVNQVMGDGIMALFGAPIAHEDHAVRACYTALGMQEAMRRYSEEVRRAQGIEVQIRVGLHSGEVVVRAIASDLHMDYTAVGQTTHLAARMEQLAPPGSIRLTAETLRLAEGFVQVTALGPVPVKGLVEPVAVFELVGAGPARTRLQATSVRGLTRFVGRDAELAALHQALEQAGAGHGQVVALVGEPGVGKSRLVYECTRSHRTQGWLVLESSVVVVGEIGGGGRQEQLALGDTPNIAARLQSLAAPDTVVISAVTYELVQGYFTCHALGTPELKGVAQPLSVYQVLHASGMQTRLDVAAARGLTPLVGRDAEVALLRERWAQVIEGQGQIIVLTGEAGIGKSRLVQSLKDYGAQATHTRWECRCSPYYQNTALYPLIDLLHRALDWHQLATPAEKLATLEQALRQYRHPLAETVPLVAQVLSLALPGERYPPLALSPQRQKQKTLETLLAMVLEVAEHQPLLLIVEDLHWVDPTTLEWLSLVVDQAPTTALCVLGTCRPEFQAPWGSRSCLTQLTLRHLTRPHVEQLIGQVSGGKTLPAEVMRHLVEKTDGVPLFVEELTKTVLESGLLIAGEGQYTLTGPVSAVAIPTTLQDSLMARLDRLVTAKGVAQLGATIGRQCFYELLHAVADLEDATLQHELRRLVDAEVLYQRGVPPQATYVFKHALIQDAAYQSLLKSTRQQYHRQIAQVLQAQFPDTAATQPELLAHHYTEAGLSAPAVGFWYQAGQHASQRSAHVEAVAYLTKGLDVLAALPETPERARHELALQIALGPVLMITRGHGGPDVERVYNRARVLCQQVEETAQVFPVLWGLWQFYLFRAEYQTSHELGQQLLSLAHSAQDPALLLMAHDALGTTLLFQGPLAASLTHFEGAIALYDPQQHRALAVLYAGEDSGVVCRGLAAFTLWFLGYPDQALARVQDARRLAHELAHLYSLTETLAFAAWVHQFRGEAQSAYEQAAATITSSTEQGFAIWEVYGTLLRGWALAAQGQRADGIAQMQQGLAAYRAMGAEVLRPYFLALLAEAYGKAGQIEAGLTLLAEALAEVATTGEHLYEPELYRLKGELTLALSAEHHADAETCFRQALDMAHRQEAKSLELRAAMSLARLWQHQSKRAEAHQLLAEVYGWFSEGFDTADLRAAKALIEELA